MQRVADHPPDRHIPVLLDRHTPVLQDRHTLVPPRLLQDPLLTDQGHLMALTVPTALAATTTMATITVEEPPSLSLEAPPITTTQQLK